VDTRPKVVNQGCVGELSDELSDGSCVETIKCDGQELLRGRFSLDGATITYQDNSTLSGCTAVALRTDATRSIDCAESKVDVYPVTSTVPFASSALRILPGVSPFLAGSFKVDALASNNLLLGTGYLSGMALIGDPLRPAPGDKIVIAGSSELSDPSSCSGIPTSQLFVVDPTVDPPVLERTITASVSCLRYLAADPGSRDTFLGAYRTGVSGMIGRFDLSGTLLKYSTGVSGGKPCSGGYEPLALQVAPDGSAAFLEVGLFGSETHVGLRVMPLDSFVLADCMNPYPVGVKPYAYAVTPAFHTDSSTTSESNILISELGSSAHVLTDKTSGARCETNSGLTSLYADDITAKVPGYVRWIGADGSGPLLVGSLDDPGYLFTASMGYCRVDFKHAGASFELRASPWASARWPDRGNATSRALVGLTSSTAALLALYHTDEGHFLPGTLPVGWGLVGEMVESGGAVYATLPWAGVLLKVSPR
jgi:hypothetical protein